MQPTVALWLLCAKARILSVRNPEKSSEMFIAWTEIHYLAIYELGEMQSDLLNS